MLRGKGAFQLLAIVLALGVLALGLYGGWVAPGAEAQERRGEPGVAAKIDDQVITLKELEKAVAVQLARLEEEKFHLLQSKLEELIEERLLAREAKRRGVTTEALLKAEVFSKVPEVTEAEVTAFITQNKTRLQEETAELRRRVRDHLGDQKVTQQRRAYVASLEQGVKVQRFLEEPEPIRVAVKVEGAFMKGPKNAPVTIVEFSDFQ